MNPMTNMKNVQRMNDLELERGWNPKTSWHNQYKDSAWVFVGGLPYDLTEGDVLAVFSQYGEVVNVNLVRDKTTGKQKGFGFICYEDQRSTILAVDNFNGIKLLGRVLRVDHVQNYKPPDDKDEDDDLTLQLKAQGCGPEVQLVPRKTEEEEGEDDGLLPLQPSDKIDKKKKKLKKEKKEKKKKKKKKRSDSSSEGSPEPVRIKQEPLSPPPRAEYNTKPVAIKTEPPSPNPRRSETQLDRFDDRLDRRRKSRSQERDYDRNKGEGSRYRSRSRSLDRSRHGNEDRRGERDGKVRDRGDRRDWSRDKRGGERERNRERQMDDRRGRDRDRR